MVVRTILSCHRGDRFVFLLSSNLVPHRLNTSKVNMASSCRFIEDLSCEPDLMLSSS